MSTNVGSIYKKVIAVVLAFVMVFSVFTMLPIIKGDYAYGAGETGKVTGSTLFVRSGAGTNYSKLGYLKKGATFTVTGTAKDRYGATWYRLKYRSKTGYVAAKYVYIKQDSVNTVENSKGTVATKRDPLTVRKGPGSKYGSLGKLAKGTSFAITGSSTDSAGVVWYRLTYKGKTGYVSSAYVRVTTTTTQPTPDDSTSTPVTHTRGTVATKKDPLTVRSGAGTRYSKLGKIAKGKTFDINGQQKDSSGVVWYKFVFNGKDGYVSSKFIKVTQVSIEDPGEEQKPPVEPEKPTVPEVKFQLGTITTSNTALNVRSGPGSSYSKLGTLAKGACVTITGSAKDKNGKIWYTYQFSTTKTGYICSDYVKISEVTSNGDFEAYLNQQGFPESYKPGLRALHAAHPNWVFKANSINATWSKALSAQTASPGTNLVSKSVPVSYRNPDTYNPKTGVWARYDGSWYSANHKVVAHYLDPRNFLNENGIYQFMTHKYDGTTQNVNTVSSVVAGSFMATRNPGCGYSSYAALINDAGKAANVNPNVLAAMIYQEQGVNGTSGLISGKYPGYEGYYNFFNYGAFKTASGSATLNGLKYAKKHGWNSVYNAIYGGAKQYGSGYVNKNQETYYYKKFNVKNGIANMGTHQYMTHVSAAVSEGKLVKKAFSSNAAHPVTFEIPVYKSMPATPCQLP